MRTFDQEFTQQDREAQAGQPITVVFTTSLTLVVNELCNEERGCSLLRQRGEDNEKLRLPLYDLTNFMNV